MRIATFNVENLFDRVAIINLEDSKESAALLKLADKLQAELKKTTYDIPKITELLTALKGFVTVRVDSGRFENRRTGEIVATGAGDWNGAIEFTRERFGPVQRKNTAAVMKAINADLMCLVEVEGRQALNDFGIAYFNRPTRFHYNMLIDSPNDRRGIDLALQWKMGTATRLRSNAYDQGTLTYEDKGGVKSKIRNVFSRDCLEVELLLENGKSLHLLGNHFKSKSGGDPPESKALRKLQAERVVEYANTRYRLDRDLVIVLGDLNDTPDSDPLKPLKDEPKLHDVFDIVGHPADDRWTYYYHDEAKARRRTQIDYILVSEATKNKVKSVEVFRGGMSAVAEGHIDGATPMKGITSWKNAASDHAAIVVDIDV